MTPFHRRLYAAALAALVACLPVAARDDSSWLCAASTVVNVCGDVPAEELRRAARTVVTFREAILGFFPTEVRASSVPTTMVVFKSRGAFFPYLPATEKGGRDQSVGGYFVRLPTRNYIALALDSGGQADVSLVLHEYTHYLAERTGLRLPAWLSEGLAEYYSTFVPLADGEFRVGVVPRSRVELLRERSFLPLAQVVDPASAERIFRNKVQLPSFYAQAWAMTHYLALGHEGRRQGQMDAYLAGLRAGQSDRQAFERAFGPLSALESELNRYLARTSFPAIRYMKVVVGPARSPTPTVSDPLPMSKADALQLQADLLASMGWTTDAERKVRESLALSPASRTAKVTLGRVHEAADRLDDAERTLTEVVTEAPDDFDASYELGQVLMRAEKYAHAYDRLTVAASLKPDVEATWLHLSLAASAVERDAEAEAAFARAERLSSSLRLMLQRIVGSLQIDRPTVAIAASHQYLAAAGPDEDTAYAALYGATGAWRAKRPEDASVFAAAAKVSSMAGSWPTIIAGFVSGEISAEALVSKAKTDGQRTEAYAYVGLKAEADGDRPSALRHLKWVEARGLKRYVEYGLAKAALRRLAEP